jgi:hypothetical protein
MRTEFERIRNMSPFSPALVGDGQELLLDPPQGNRHQGRLPDLPSMGVGVEAVISDGDLALVRDMGGDPGDELQIVHPLYFFAVNSSIQVFYVNGGGERILLKKDIIQP